MTVLEKFVAFAEGLSAERRQAIENLLADMMGAEDAESAFTPAELAELQRRLDDPNPQYADPKDIAAIIGTTFDD
jgi:hypothetical protein